MIAENDGIPEENTQPPVPPQGGQGVLEDPHHSRADARMAARLIAMGVVPEEVAAAVLRKSFTLAAKSDNPRDYAAVMGVPIAATKLELEAVKTSYLAAAADEDDLPEGLREIQDEDFFGNSSANPPVTLPADEPHRPGNGNGASAESPLDP